MSKTTFKLLQLTDLVLPSLRFPLKSVEVANEPGASPGTTVHYGQSSWGSTTSPKTITLTTSPGDLIVVYGMSESDNSGTGAIPIDPTLTGNGITWTLQESNGGVIGTTPNRGSGKIWWGIDSVGGTNWTLTATRPASGAHMWSFGAIVIAAANHNGIGNSMSITTNGVSTQDFTTAYDNSYVLFAMVDWSANANSGRDYRVVNGFEPLQGAGNMGELNYWNILTNYSIYGLFYPDVGVAGLDNYGVTNGTFGGLTMMAIEIKKSVGGGGPVEFEGWGVPI